MHLSMHQTHTLRMTCCHLKGTAPASSTGHPQQLHLLPTEHIVVLLKDDELPETEQMSVHFCTQHLYSFFLSLLLFLYICLKSKISEYLCCRFSPLWPNIQSVQISQPNYIRNIFTKVQLMCVYMWLWFANVAMLDSELV